MTGLKKTVRADDSALAALKHSRMEKIMTIYEFFQLMGGVGLFLYGMSIMSTGLKNILRLSELDQSSRAPVWAFPS